MTETRILITGGSGFIGTNAMDFFLNQGFDLINFDINPPKKSIHEPYWKKVDIRDKDLLEKELVGFAPTHILHLAANLGMDVKDISFFSANTDGVKNLLEAAAHCPSLKHVVFTSSLLVCKNGYIPQSDDDYCPPNLYGQSKMIGEKLVRGFPKSNFTWSIVRPTSIWGPWFAYSYRSFFKTINRGFYFHLGNTTIVKPSSFTGNTVFMMMKILFGPKQDVQGKTFYISDYPGFTTKQWADVIQQEMGVRKIKSIPVWALRMIGFGGDFCKLFGWDDPPMSSFRLKNMLTGGIYPIEQTMKLCGPLPYSLQEGVKETIKWMRESGDIR
jgi:GlcNAc-P-P-Und epimerase